MRLVAGPAAALLLALATPVQAQPGDEAAIRVVIETFRTAIIAKDAAALAKLQADDHITFMSSIDDATLARMRPVDPGAERTEVSSFGDFIIYVTGSKDRLEEVFSNVMVQTDGAIASVYFDYDFLENGVLANRGRESWGMIRTDDGWKIASIIYSIELPETP